MSQIRKHTWKGLAVVAAMLLSVGLMTQSAFAVITSNGGTTTVPLATNAATGTNVFTTLSADIVLTGSATPDFGVVGAVTLTAPAGWNFNTALSGVMAVTYAGTGLAGPATATVTATTISVTTTGAATAWPATITFDTSAVNLVIKPLTSNSQPGFITGSVGGNAHYINSSSTSGQVAITSSAATVTSDGTTTATLTFVPRDTLGAALLNTVVNVTVSRGTLSVTSNTTPTSSCTSGTTGSCTLTFRGNGTTGTANVTATTAAPNEAIGLFSLQVVAPTTNPTGIKHFATNNSGHVAASTQSVYTSPTIGSRVRFQVTSGTTTGVNTELVQATVDKGYIVQGDTTVNGTVPGSCAGNNTTASDTSHLVAIDGTDYDGIAEFTVCATAGVVGPIKVTAKNLSTTMTDATTTLTSAGVPNKITAVTTGGAVTVTVTDKDNNEVAEGTTVLFSVPAFTGTVAPACTTTTNGKASAAAAFSGAGGQVLVTVFINDTGNAPASTCAALGSSAAVAQTVNLGTGVTPPSSTVILGAVPAAGRFGLIGLGTATTVDGVIAAATTMGCNVESVSVTSAASASGWLVHIKGAPAVVNTPFPGTAALGPGGAGLRCL